MGIYTALTGNEVYPGIDYVSLYAYILLVGCIVVVTIHFFIGYYFSNKVKLPRI